VSEPRTFWLVLYRDGARAAGGGVAGRVTGMSNADTTTTSLGSGCCWSWQCPSHDVPYAPPSAVLLEAPKAVEVAPRHCGRSEQYCCAFCTHCFQLGRLETQRAISSKILVARGRVKALFSEKAFDRFMAMQYFIAASGS
jgi:hypothetical protein